MTLKLGIIGCGGMGLRHMHGISELMKYSEIMKLEAHQDDDSRYETFLNSVSEELKYAYIEGYHSEQRKVHDIELKDLRIKVLELVQKNKNNESTKLVVKKDEIESLHNNFDAYVRGVLIKKANKLNNGGYTNE